jgi:hypothetical protein
MDRRFPRVSIQQLRRDLREADEDRYRLTAVIAHRSTSAGPSTPRIVGLLMLLSAAFGSAYWTAGAPVADVAAAIPLQASSMVPIAGWHSEPVIERQVVVHGSTAIARTRGMARSRRHVSTTEGMLARPRTPRPLHPGEFGR